MLFLFPKEIKVFLFLNAYSVFVHFGIPIYLEIVSYKLLNIIKFLMYCTVVT